MASLNKNPLQPNSSVCLEHIRKAIENLKVLGYTNFGDKLEGTADIWSIDPAHRGYAPRTPSQLRLLMRPSHSMQHSTCVFIFVHWDAFKQWFPNIFKYPKTGHFRIFFTLHRYFKGISSPFITCFTLNCIFLSECIIFLAQDLHGISDHLCNALQAPKTKIKWTLPAEKRALFFVKG